VYEKVIESMFNFAMNILIGRDEQLSKADGADGTDGTV